MKLGIKRYNLMILVAVASIGVAAAAITLEHLEDRTVSFGRSFEPQGYYEYDLENMLTDLDSLPCSLNELVFRVTSETGSLMITSPDADNKIKITPIDWSVSASAEAVVEAYCYYTDPDAIDKIISGKDADVILITDFSGSMKKAINSWGQGTGQQECEALFTYPDARKTHLATCLDTEFIDIVLNESVVQNNRVWPVYMHNNYIKSFVGDANSNTQVQAYINDFAPQGMDKTCIGCALNRGYSIFDANPDVYNDNKRIVILMTDGVPTHCSSDGCMGYSSIYGVDKCTGFCDTQGQDECGTDTSGCNDDACVFGELNTRVAANRLWEDEDVTFFTVGFGIIETCHNAAELLKQVALMSGGMYFHSQSPTELRQIYRTIANLIIEETIVIPGKEKLYYENAILRINYIADSGVMCGNSIIDLGEQCDNPILAGCSFGCYDPGEAFDPDSGSDLGCSCKPLPVCGNNIWEPPVEECDLGAGNSDTAPNTCRTDCTNPTCGDQVIDSDIPYGEECDDGAANSDTADACRTSCKKPICGDSIRDAGEECDEGLFPTLTCLAGCFRPEPCGNGNLDPGEGCDDGGICAGSGDTCKTQGILPCFDGSNCVPQSNDGCSDTCQSEKCGDNIIQTGPVPDRVEQCDGAVLGMCTACQPPGHAFECKCVPEQYCGNGIWEPFNWEECDWREPIPPNRCGDGRFCLSSGTDADGNTLACTCFTPPGTGAYCGNGIKAADEDCDRGTDDWWAPGNGIDDFCDVGCYPPYTADECSCIPEITDGCGDGLIDHDSGEECEQADISSCINSHGCYAPGTPKECTCWEHTTKEVYRGEIFRGETDTIEVYKEYLRYIFAAQIFSISQMEPTSGNLMFDYWGLNVVKITADDNAGYVPDSVMIRISDPIDGEISTQLKLKYDIVEKGTYDWTGEDTKLLLAKGNVISNYYSDPNTGETVHWGPYVITVKVWEKGK